MLREGAAANATPASGTCVLHPRPGSTIQRTGAMPSEPNEDVTL